MVETYLIFRDEINAEVCEKKEEKAYKRFSVLKQKYLIFLRSEVNQKFSYFTISA